MGARRVTVHKRQDLTPFVLTRLGTTLSLHIPAAVSPAWLVQVLHGLQD